MTPVGSDLADRVLGGWLGRIAGNMLGKPVEQGDYWTRDRIDRYLRQAAALPLTDYLPEPADRARASFALRPEWRRCVRGRIHGSCRDDDVDYAILGLHLLETHGFGFSTEQVGDLWLLRLPYLQTFTAERAAYRNLANGLKPPLTATYDNPYQEWIGALIRADVYGWTCPGDPRRAASLARRDAVLSHTGNGVYGAMWAAALVAAAFTAPTVRHALDTALTVIPASSRLARTVRRVLTLHETAAELGGHARHVGGGDGRARLDPHGPERRRPHGRTPVRRRATSPAPSRSRSAAAWTPTRTARPRVPSRACCAEPPRSRRSGRTRWRTPCAARCSASTAYGSVNWRSAQCGWR